jgi:hypothetical protein
MVKVKIISEAGTAKVKRTRPTTEGGVSPVQTSDSEQMSHACHIPFGDTQVKRMKKLEGAAQLQLM